MDSSIIFRLTQALADRYRVDAELGAGGMATVYRAHDLKHGRDVAIKVLHPDLGAALGGERFLSEIRTTARLQHPHILPLLDSGVADGLLYYVMPLVTGETLRARLERERQLPVDDAVRIAREVAAALEHAHRQGVIHRDIKPENILLQDGSALVADFGIALAIQQAGGARLTQTGLSLGTPQYMSPEQATGDRIIDARSDQYSLGAVVYEMLAGEPPFVGPSMQAVIARLLTEEPRGITPQRKVVPEAVEHAVLKALQKLPADRYASLSEFAGELVRPDAAPLGPSRSTQKARAARPSSRGWLVAAALPVAAVGAFLWGRTTAKTAGAVDAVPMRLDVELPDSLELIIGAGGRLAISADGRQLAFMGRLNGRDEARGVYVRALDQTAARLVPGTTKALNPFFSQDGTKLGFIDREVGRIVLLDLATTQTSTIGDTTLRIDHATWESDGMIYAAVDRPREGLVRIDPQTGKWRQLTTIEKDSNETSHRSPQLLPSGDALIFIGGRLPSLDPALREVMVVDLRNGARKVLTRGVHARVIGRELLVVHANGELTATTFDESSFTLTGQPRLLARDVYVAPDFGFADVVTTARGTLMYLAAEQEAGRSRLVWFDRSGRPTPADSTWLADFRSVAVSPNGQRLAVTLVAQTREEVWIKDPNSPPVRLSADAGNQRTVRWSADGKRVLYTDNERAPYPLVSRSADGMGEPRIEARESRNIATGMMAPNGSWILYRSSSNAVGHADILGIRIGDTTRVPLIATESDERHPTLSYDSRWLAYRKADGPVGQVYVQPFPSVNDARWQVPQTSYAGTTDPVFSRAERELFYISGDNDLTALHYDDTPTFQIRSITRLFSLPEDVRINPSAQRFDVAPDGRFLMIQAVENSGRRHTRRRPRLTLLTLVDRQGPPVATTK